MIRPSGFSRAADLTAVHWSALLKGAVATLLLCLSWNRIWAEDQTAASISREVKDVFDGARKAVVKVHGVDEHSDIYGTGVFIDPTGTLYTAYAVGGEADNFTIEFEGKTYPA